MTNETLHTLETRRSCRAYKPEQITKEELEAVLRAGTFAPSAMNRQSAKIVVVQDGSLVMGNLMNAAAAIGLGSCWINRAKEEFETEEGKALLKKWGIEGDYIGVGHCILGYPAEEPRPAAPRKPDYIVYA
ncbi:nitroreductase family protein [Faecalibacterium sp. DFI.5.82]|uniref:nitroreductase family protein n=1 Tax=Faecalibacterium sp. DFI.5.82 TaxID=3031725 RepID=UPI0023B061B8|nr:nitroreductase family protein [Faecalibacterium sp. DFI.5.82]MDE8690867.1 nitroreductase family protein [Faecalibacterium sp. DFI.5.82]